VARTLHRVLAQAPTGELLFVLHKGVIRSIVSELLGVDEVHRRRLCVALGSIHILARDHEAWYAETLDCVGHL
jgi:broad specificity phosphatase PhoE